jgi:hypothetical protein
MEFLKTLGSVSRRAFLGLGITTVGIVVAIRKSGLFVSRKKKTARFLTRDGRLVEVDLTKLPVKRKVADKQQLISWIWKDQKL